MGLTAFRQRPPVSPNPSRPMLGPGDEAPSLGGALPDPTSGPVLAGAKPGGTSISQGPAAPAQRPEYTANFMQHLGPMRDRYLAGMRAQRQMPGRPMPGASIGAGQGRPMGRPGNLLHTPRGPAVPTQRPGAGQGISGQRPGMQIMAPDQGINQMAGSQPAQPLTQPFQPRPPVAQQGSFNPALLARLSQLLGFSGG